MTPDTAVLSLDLDGFSLDGLPILGGLSLCVERGETLVITGPSGVGKTTLLRILAGLQGGWTGHLRAPDRRAMVFQEPTLLPWRTLIENLCLVTGIDSAQAEAALSDVGLAGQGGKVPGQLSLGQQRRLSLARAFAARPEILFMDEPFVSLDAETWDQMLTLFETLRARDAVTTVLVTHSMEEAERLGTRILRLDGRPARFA